MIRRDFLKNSSLLGFGATVPTFLAQSAQSAPMSDRAGAKDTILVVVQLTGGNDGLNTVIPIKNDLYYQYRPTIAIPKGKAVTLRADLGLHPSFAAFGKLIQETAAACIVQGVGYPNPDQSHFRSMDIWQAGSTAETLAKGWLGQSLQQKAMPAFHLAAGNETSPLAFAGAPARVPSMTSLQDFQLKLGASGSTEMAEQKKLIESVATSNPAKNGLLNFVRRTAVTTYESTNKLQQIGKNYTPKVPYPNSGLANRLKLAAQLIDAGVGVRILYVSHDGFDTHSGQGGLTGAHANLLQTVGDAISAFYRDLAARGHADRLCIMTFSEFGRRGKENGSQGTDHGSGAPVFLAGGRLKPGIVGEHPDLAKLDNGNLPFGIDFRRVYASILTNWLGVDPKPILGAEFAPIDLFKA